jgi:16S rRNA (cytidine1402-2'-O)-methyltransferase
MASSPGGCSGDVAGTLYVVATPLGNLGDLSPRAADTLKRVPVVAAEDTRHSKPLLNHAGSRADLVSFHAHSSERALERILRILTDGRDVALITDAGTPAISDPGVELVAAARERGIQVVTIPGPNAVAASLSVSGIGADRYVFLGFLPRKGSDRRRLLLTVAESEWTVVLFEAPNRVTQLLADLIEACGPDRQASVSRELTKIFEETRAGTLQELSNHYAEAPVRGEVTVVVMGTGKPRVEEPPPDPAVRARALLDEGLSRKDVADRLAEETGISRNTAYKLVNEL